MTASMEVPYLLLMLRRRLWVLVLGLLLGVLLAVLVGLGQERYQSQAQLLIGSPASGNSDANSLERNVISQLSVLRSSATASAVSKSLDRQVSPEEVAQSTTISEVAGSDVVVIETITSDARRSQAIADGYVDVYLKRSAAQVQSRIAPEVERIDARLTALNQEISQVNEQLAAAVRPFVRVGGTTAIPDPRTVAPEAAARQELLLNEYDRLLGQRQQLEQEQRLQTISTVLQEAVADSVPLGPDRRRQVGIVLIAAMLSVAVAVAIDAISGRTVGNQEVEQALGARIAARSRSERRLRRTPARLLSPGRDATEDERLLRLKAERLCPVDGRGLIVVTGAAPGSGATTTALSLALQFASSGRNTVVIDALGGPASLTAALGERGTWRNLPVAADPASLASALVPVTPQLLLLADAEGGAGHARGALNDVLAALPEQTEIVVLDMEASSGLSMAVAGRAHAVVLTVDAFHSKARHLEELGVVLSDLADRLLPVLTHPTRRRSRASAGDRPAALPAAEPVTASAGGRAGAATRSTR